MKKQKKELRKLIRQQKTQYCVSTLKSISDSVLEKLEKENLFQASNTILLYFSMDDEVHTHQFIEKWSKTKTILLPVVVGDVLELRIYSHKNDLITGEYGIKEPTGPLFTSYDSIDLAIIPGMAFDSKGNRLGRGKGYYDKLLPLIKAPKIGICFPFQLLNTIPVEQFDICMDKVIT
ncbi:5-formyltetrahydrofolate cyclo-ligase [Bacteroides sp. 519]|uniref:5-formyltetrahydrofolate cyclo-ligase n=1 Tax=Bacteroides sp. 519 TaxID=2302937 RepID=UPI0013D897F4|nr:5-formyltetrahydrofolate cyclo-ligase [Bacteroides sp. 519]NDV59274.1 5-formyltetrahydrofolate cyclo-ligase [Bacteroides sp. 519]